MSLSANVAKKKKKKRGEKDKRQTQAGSPCPGSWVAALAPATDGNTGGQAPQCQRGAKHHPGRAAHEWQAGQSPLPAPQGLPQRVRWHFYIHTTVSPFPRVWGQGLTVESTLWSAHGPGGQGQG